MDKKQIYINQINCLDNLIKNYDYRINFRGDKESCYYGFKHGLNQCETQYRKEKLEAKVKIYNPFTPD